jgi:hypothetical protein
MKILFLHQPFPMGNYKIIPYIAQQLSKSGHQVFTLEQLNGLPANQEYYDLIQQSNFDVVYYEMLDLETFKIVSLLKNCKRILCYASKGVFDTFEEILKYHGVYYDSILTNSEVMYQKFIDANIESKHFKYYPAPVSIEDAVYTKIYSYDCVYLGGGFQRLSKPEYQRERDIVYTNPNIVKFGNGWTGVDNYKGILPPDDIAKLYCSAKTAIATIEPSQRTMGMINNRYSEIFKVGNKLLSIDYPEINFYGGEEFITFVHSQDAVLNNISDIDPEIKRRQFEFILDQELQFFNQLQSLL